MTGVDAGRAAQAEQRSAERVARNEAAFREANESIRAKAESWAMDGRLPVLCECADVGCTEVLQLTAREYEDVRSEPRWFATAPGHYVNAEGWGRRVAEHGGFDVVEKIGGAGEIVERLDPRSGDAA